MSIRNYGNPRNVWNKTNVCGMEVSPRTQFRTRKFEGHFLGGINNLSRGLNMSSQVERLEFLINRKEVSLPKLAMSHSTVCRDMIQWAALSAASWQIVFLIFYNDNNNKNYYLSTEHKQCQTPFGSFPSITWNPFFSPAKWEISLFDRWKNCGSKSLSNLSNLLKTDRARIKLTLFPLGHVAFVRYYYFTSPWEASGPCWADVVLGKSK